MSNFDENLTPVLSQATNEDLAPLVGYILKAATEELTKSDLYKRFSPNHKEYVEVIEREIRKFGGNTIVNLFFETGPKYLEIVGDVAGKLGANFNKNSTIDEIEAAILMRVMNQAWEKMTPEEKRDFMKEMGLESSLGNLPTSFPMIALQAAIRASGFAAYRLTLIVANALAKAILGRGLTFAANRTLARAISVFAGPIGWVITGIWTAVDLAGPAYRVTIPCVVHIAMLRRQFSLKTCKECSTPYTAEVKFCPNCGAKIEQEDQAKAAAVGSSALSYWP